MTTSFMERPNGRSFAAKQKVDGYRTPEYMTVILKIMI
jgi:hypothetical protein